MFKWTYWNLLLKGKELPIGPDMSLIGKKLDKNCELIKEDVVQPQLMEN